MPPESPSPVHRLQPHPAHPAPATAGAAVRVALRRTPGSRGGLDLTYTIAAAGLGVPLPLPRGAGERADRLWQRTCGELFVAPAGAPSYREFNFSPSGDWAAYDFDAYRQPAAALPQAPAPPPQIDCLADAAGFRLRVRLAAAWLPAAAALRLGLSLVLEASDGGLSYWALAHPAAGPDFHHPDAFILPLP